MKGDKPEGYAKPMNAFRYGIRFKIFLSIAAIMVVLMGIDIAWNVYLQNEQAQNEAREGNSFLIFVTIF